MHVSAYMYHERIWDYSVVLADIIYSLEFSAINAVKITTLFYCVFPPYIINKSNAHHYIG